MNSDTSDLICGDLVVINTDVASVKQNLSTDNLYYTGFYKTVVPISNRPSTGWRRWIGPRRLSSVGLIIGSGTNRSNERFDRAFVLWEGEIVEARCNHLRKA
jgi:hypothetical protein